jgi:acyl-CoA dehydrogenase
MIDEFHELANAGPMDLKHLHWPFFEAEHRALANRFAAWAWEHLTPFESNEGGDGQAARLIFEMLGHAGWIAQSLPRSWGAFKRLDLRGMSLIREICAYSSAIADVSISEPWLGILPIALFGSEALQQAYLPHYLSGKLLPAFALSEPDAGSDAAAIVTNARREKDCFVLNGRKTWTSNCGLADLYVVFARLDDTISAFALDGCAEGIILEEPLPVLSPHTVGTWALKDCRVPLDHQIGETGQGLKVALTVLELYRSTVGAAAVGLARRALREGLYRSLERTAFKKAICEHQLIQAKLAKMVTQLDASALLVYRAAWEHDHGGKDTARAAAMAKLHASEAAFEVIDEAVQIFGGRGVLHGSVVERLFRHSRAFRIFDGTSEIQQLIIARNLLENAATSSRPGD